MKTISVEQTDSSLLLVVTAVIVLVLLAIDFLVLRRLRQTKKQAILLGLVMGVATAIIAFGLIALTTTHTNDTNTQSVKNAASEIDQVISDEQAAELKDTGVLILDDNQTLVFSDEGNAFTLTYYNDEENAKAQAEEDEKREKSITDGEK